jgi:hypothetical protein
MSDTTYNGWTNYATWRVNLEIFDGLEQSEVFDLSLPLEQLRHVLQDYVEGHIYEAGGGEGNIAVDYALAFLSDVNWYEIAEHMIEDNTEEITDGITTDLHRSTDSANP